MTAKALSAATDCTALDARLLRVVDAGFLAVICAAPWFLGGRHPLGEFVLVALATLVGVAWLARQAVSPRARPWRRTAADWLLLGGLVILLLQLVPLPAPLLEAISPRLAAILPLWNAASDSPARLGQWVQVSVAPAQTQAALALYLSYACLFLVAVQRIECVADVERLLRAMALSAVLLSAVGILQYLAGNGKFLWIYQHAYRRVDDAVKGPLVNKNHFAHLLALQLGPLLWLLLRAQRSLRERDAGSRATWLYGLSLLALAVVLFAGLMTLSRGGVAMMAVAAAVSLGVLYRGGQIGGRFVLGLAGVFALIGGSLAIHGYQTVAQRMDDYVAGSLDELDQHGYRRKLWEADLRGVADFCRLGSGAGTHADVYPLYLDEPWPLEFTHAENGYLQIALETGLPGLVLLLGALALVALWCRAALRPDDSRRQLAAAAAIAAGLIVSALHSLADFVWYIPACMSLTVLLAACACRLAQLRGASTWPLAVREAALPRPALAAALALAVVGGGWLCFQHGKLALAGLCWDEYLRFAHSPSARSGNLVPDQAVVDNLEALLRWTPGDARARQRAAAAYSQRFNAAQVDAENAMPLNQIRDAAMASRFRSRAELDGWLKRAIGPGYAPLDRALRHAHAAAAASPLQGKAYALLSELCFLEGQGPAGKAAYIEQAVLVRPNDGAVLAAAGSHAILMNRQREAISYWRRALQSGEQTARQLVEQFAAAPLPSQAVTTLFEPDLPTTRLIHARYAQLESPAALRPLLDYYARLVRQAAAAGALDAAEACLELQEICRQQGDHAGRIAALRQALQSNPNHYDAHFLLGMCLADAGALAEAREQVEWCLQRRPHDAELQQRWQQVARQRVASRPADSAARK